MSSVLLLLLLLLLLFFVFCPVIRALYECVNVYLWVRTMIEYGCLFENVPARIHLHIQAQAVSKLLFTPHQCALRSFYCWLLVSKPVTQCVLVCAFRISFENGTKRNETERTPHRIHTHTHGLTMKRKIKFQRFIAIGIRFVQFIRWVVASQTVSLLPLDYDTTT